MPTILPEGVRVPAGDDAYALTEDMRRAMETTTTVASLPTAASRAGLLSALNAAGRPATEASPAFVHRADGPDLEVSTVAGEWRAVGPPEIFTGPAPSGGTVTTSALALQLVLQAKPYKRRLMCFGSVFGTITTGTWDTALSVNATAVLAAQRFARMSSGGDTASMVLPYELDAGVVGTVRLWYRLISGSGSIVASASEQYTNLSVHAWRV